ncbi:hypothetical protein [Paenibacillus sp. 23TSA30-6]|uniref:hypothetical protein n=1 Tax=Paenibacillus sp. 23TSA30-6 TaxID=2546104 RepID=UPI001EE23AAA|nr:hypothetical protein [Paenibacillus sp. 23TSA30-6]
METRLIPVIDASGYRSYMEVPGKTFFEAACLIDGLLSEAVRLDMSLLHLTEQELHELGVRKECRQIRTQLLYLYQDSIDALNDGHSIQQLRTRIDELTVRLYELEESIGKNEEYEGLIVPRPSTHRITGEKVGQCQQCERAVYSGQKYPDPEEEGLFCNYHCRTLYRRNNKKSPL